MSLKKLFQAKELHFVLFGGKGGVGKTTCAAASAIWAAENLDKKILVISTDPAHSLGDSLGIPLKIGEVTPIPDVKNLWGLEINPKLEKSEIFSALNTMPELNTPFSHEMLELADLNPPGIDEALAFGKVLEFLDNSDYDLIIFDTAPTGHTLRLLALPDVLSGWIGKLIMLRLRLGKIFSFFKNIFGGKRQEQEEDPIKIIKKLKIAVETAKETLNDPKKTSFIIVLIPEAMAIYETERLLSSLIEYSIPVHNLIVNQLYPENTDCKFCRIRYDMQQKHLSEIKYFYGDEFDITELPLFSEEVRRIEKLRKVAERLFK